MENTKNQQKKQYFATLWRGLQRENKTNEKTKKPKQQNSQKNQKIKKSQNYRPHVTPCHNSPDMRCIVFDHTLAN